MQFESKRRDLRRLTSREYAGVAGNGVAAWRETLSGVFDITTEVTDIETFNGEFHAWASEGYAVSRSSSSKCGLCRSLQALRRWPIDGLAVRLVLSGSLSI